MSTAESSASSEAEKRSAASSSEGEGNDEGDADADGDEEIQCDLCKGVIEGDAARFECLVCNVRRCRCIPVLISQSFDVCGDCYFAEEGRSIHQHPLTKAREVEVARIVWEFKDSKTSHSIMIGNWSAAVPSLCSELSIKSVKTVLSLMEKSEMEDHAPQLHEIYKGKPYVRHEGIVYSHIAMPDAMNPALVFEERPDLKDVFERATLWIDKALQKGNVLVHCQKGQKRSPTIVLSWLVTQKYGVQEAVNHISRSYTSSSYSVTDPRKSWGGKYAEERPLWIKLLGEWAGKWRTNQEIWKASHLKLIQAWEVLHRGVERPAAPPVAAADQPDAKRAKSGKEEKK